MYLKQFFVEGIGHASYLIASDETAEAAVIDPRRDVDAYLTEARREGFTIRYVLETHNHNDFISGGKQLAEGANAELVVSAEAGLRFAHHGVREGDELRLGELRIRALFTPGHTPEHVSYIVIDTARAEEPVLVFTGGNLLVGAVGRPDLLGAELGRELAPLLYDSLHGKIMRLEDYVEVLPTHGGGSLCGRGIASKRTTTIGYERRFNAALQIEDRQAFVEHVLAGNPGIPTYYRRMRPTNQQGPRPWHLPEASPLAPSEVEHLVGHDAIVLDIRPSADFAAGHVPGAVNFELAPDLATWVGWLLPHDVPIVLVLQRDEQWADVVTRLARVGYERVIGYLRGGMGAWRQAGLAEEREEQWSVSELRNRLDDDNLQIVDIRMDSEWAEGHIAGAVHISLDTLLDRLALLDRDRQTVIICGSGHRSSIALGLLRGRGFGRLVHVPGGMWAWRAAGFPVVSGPEDELLAREAGADAGCPTC